MALTVGVWLAAALLFLLAVPFHFQVVAERESRVDVRVVLTWLYGIVRVRLHPRIEGKGSSESKDSKRKRRRSSRVARRVGKAALRPDLRARMVRFLRDLVRALRPRELRLRANIGLDDPADTGQLWGALGPLSGCLASRGVWLEPEFDGAHFSFRGTGEFRVVPLQLIAMTLLFLFSPPVIRAFVSTS